MGTPNEMWFAFALNILTAAIFYSIGRLDGRGRAEHEHFLFKLKLLQAYHLRDRSTLPTHTDGERESTPPVNSTGEA